MKLESKIYVAGHRGMVGSAIWRTLERKGYRKLIGQTREGLDLRDQRAVEAFFERERPDHVFLAAAKVGGILANNTYRADFISDNLAIQTHVIHAAYKFGVKKLLFLGSSCIYPRECPQPIKEEYLLTGPLEPTNEPYAIAKIAGLKMCEAYNHQYGTQFLSAMPTNLYGPNDNFDLKTSHVLPALVRKFVEAKERGEPCVTVWGTGNPRREFLYVDDAADACVAIMCCDIAEVRRVCSKGLERPLCHINVGSGDDVSIAELAQLISRTVGYKGDVQFDRTKPDGTPRKQLNVDRLSSLGWRATTPLDKGIRRTVEWYCEKECSSKKSR